MKRRENKPKLKRRALSDGVRRALRSHAGPCAGAVIAAGLMTLTPAAMGASPFPAALDLGALDGTNGLVLKGIDADDRSGVSVSGAGDVNGDGLDDILIGASWADPDGKDRAGESYVVFGRAGCFPAEVSLRALNGTNGLVLKGIDAFDYSGGSVSGAGDVNGDGVEDTLIGARWASPDGIPGAGESYVVFGRAGGFPAEFSLGALDGTNGLVLKGIDFGDRSGNSVSEAGDVNGDDLADIVIGAPYADPDGKETAGESYVVFGSAGGFPAEIDLAALDGTNGFVLEAIDVNDGSGGSVSSAGDVNGDGLADFVIGAPWADPDGKENAGESYVVFGSAGGFPAEIDLGALDGTNGLVLKGIDAGDSSGRSVSGAGDVNGDGVDDILIGASAGDPDGISRAGESYVVFGSAGGFPAAIDLGALDGTNGFVLKGIDAGDLSGWSVSGAGDVNGDGVDDILIGTKYADPDGKDNAGESYVVFGSAGGFPAAIDLGALDGTNGLVLKGIDADDGAGRSVSGAGDVNGDGVDDLLIGARGADPDGISGAGESYVVFGATCDIDGNGILSMADVIEFARQCRNDPCRSWCDLDGDGLFRRSDVLTFVQRCRSGTAAVAENVVEEALSALDAN
ncbi:MAG: integrin alpha [Pseudomonadota bacterium]|nr:integrin alpha [Pseudomonadota bacterium]